MTLAQEIELELLEASLWEHEKCFQEVCRSTKLDNPKRIKMQAAVNKLRLELSDLEAKVKTQNE